MCTSQQDKNFRHCSSTQSSTKNSDKLMIINILCSYISLPRDAGKVPKEKQRQTLQVAKILLKVASCHQLLSLRPCSCCWQLKVHLNSDQKEANLDFWIAFDINAAVKSIRASYWSVEIILLFCLVEVVSSLGTMLLILHSLRIIFTDG